MNPLHKEVLSKLLSPDKMKILEDATTPTNENVKIYTSLNEFLRDAVMYVETQGVFNEFENGYKLQISTEELLEMITLLKRIREIRTSYEPIFNQIMYN